MNTKAHILSLLFAKVADAKASGTATTSRYWDCKGGACGCSFGAGDKPVFCHSNAMFRAPANNDSGAQFYGTASVSQSLGGADWQGEACGKCWKLTAFSNVGNSKELKRTIVVKGTGYDRTLDIDTSDHFRIAAPGFETVDFQTCNEEESESALTEEGSPCYDWMYSPDKDPQADCNCDAFTDPFLKSGCQNFHSLMWDNPTVEYEEHPCPKELAEEGTPCWGGPGGETQPFDAPKNCKNRNELPDIVSWSGSATSSRSWDCNAGSCGCGYGAENNRNSCNSSALTGAPAGNPYGAEFYGTASVSETLGGASKLGNGFPKGCGTCWKLVANANVSSITKQTTIVVKGTGFCGDDLNGECKGGTHFVINAPGFDPSDRKKSDKNKCEANLISEQGLHPPQVCSNWMIQNEKPDENCVCTDIVDPVLRNGCEIFLGMGWDNPTVEWEQLETCPHELVISPPCFDENSGEWPLQASSECSSGTIENDALYFGAQASLGLLTLTAFV